jgi:modulator of FtsH protease HflC
MNTPLRMFFAILILMVVLVMSGLFYTVNEMEQVIITQFGKPVGDPITDSGLHIKTPLIQQVHRIDKRFLPWDGRASEMPTKDKTYLLIDTFARWRINDPYQYFLRIRDERSAKSRLDDILGSETRNAVAKHNLIEIIRTTADRIPVRDEMLIEGAESIGILYPITKGRAAIENEIFDAAAPKLVDFGIELLDIRFKRINYNEMVRQRIYDRMISERQQIAERFRSEGKGEAAKIIGRKERDMLEIESEAYKRILDIRGQADAAATDIYSKSYNQTPTAAEFYLFLKTLETYEQVVGDKSTLLLSTNSDLFKLLKNIEAK